MAEESPQNSSEYQETSEGPDVNAGAQTVNSAEDTAVAQGNQSNQAHASQKNKKYDLGVLFVHGIGFQDRGDTFKAIYPSIKNEFESNEAYRYKEVVLSNNGVPKIEAKITCDGQVKDVFFCESNWHGSSATYGNEPVCKILKRWISNLQAILWLIYFIGLRISHARIFGFLFSVSMVFLYTLLHSKWQEIESNLYDISNKGMNIRISLLWSIMNLVIPFIVILLVWEYFAGKTRKETVKKTRDRPWQRHCPKRIREGIQDGVKYINPYSVIKKAFYAFSCLLIIFIFIVAPKTLEIFIVSLVFVGLGCLVFSIFSSARIAELWNQINESADFVRTGEEFQYIRSLEHDIDKLDRKCNKIIVIAHSMGEYLSYNSIRRSMKNFKGKEVQLISVGGGLGLVSLIGDLRLSNKKNKFSGRKSAILSFGAAVQAFILATGNIFSWCGIAFDIYRASQAILGSVSWDSTLTGALPNPIFPFETENWNFNVGIHFALLVFFAVTGMYVEKISGIKMIGFNNFKFFRYSHFWDPVGNSAGFYYGRGVEQTITPYGGFGHAIRTYYTGKNIKSVKVIYDKDIYIPKRTVQHIASTVYGNSSLLHKKTKPALSALSGIISWIASCFILFFLLGVDAKFIITFLPLFCGFNYIITSLILWVWVVLDILRDYPTPINNQKIWKHILQSVCWIVFSTILCALTDFFVVLSVINIMEIKV